MCVLMSTHTLQAAEEISNRVGIMSHGRLMFEGTVEPTARALPGRYAFARVDVSCDDRSQGQRSCRESIDERRRAENLSLSDYRRHPRRRGPQLARRGPRAAKRRPRSGSCSGGCGTESHEPKCGQLLSSARLRTGLVVGLSLFFWCGLFVLFYEGFTFIVVNVGAAGATYHAQTVRFVFHLFFASLNVMLDFFVRDHFIFGALQFAGHHVHAHVAHSAGADRVVQVSGSGVLSSWGFFLLASPIMIGLRHRRQRPMVLLRAARAADSFVCVHSVQHRRYLLHVRDSQVAAAAAAHHCRRH